MNRFCGNCGTRLEVTSTRGGIPHRVCPDCGGGPSGVFAGP
ncbi:hypothetical protein [Halobacterium sp. KA-6]|nr:hypothetical protein [Halobacterium sp. KA-6]